MKLILKGLIILFVLALLGIAAYVLLPVPSKQTVLTKLLKEGTSVTNTAINDQIDGVKDDLVLMSAQVANDPSNCQPLGRTFADLKNRIDAVLVIDPNGHVKCSSDESLVSIDPSKMDSYQDFISDPSRTSIISRVFTLPNNEKALAMYVPITNSESANLGSVVGLSYLSKIIEKTFSPLSWAQAGFVTIFDDNGEIIYNSDSSFIGKNLWTDEIQNYIGHNQTLNEMFNATVQSIISDEIISYQSEGKNRIGQFYPLPVGKNHNLIILTSLSY